MRDLIANIIDPHSFLPDNSGCDLTGEMVKQGKELAYSKTDRIFEAFASADLPEEPKRPKLAIGDMKFGTCPQCGTRQNLARAEDESLICGSCADANYLADWIDYGRELRRRVSPSAQTKLQGYETRKNLVETDHAEDQTDHQRHSGFRSSPASVAAYGSSGLSPDGINQHSTELDPPPCAHVRGDGEAAIIECLAAGEPFVFDPATNFLHADDGTVEYGVRYVPAASTKHLDHRVETTAENSCAYNNADNNDQHEADQRAQTTATIARKEHEEGNADHKTDNQESHKDTPAPYELNSGSDATRQVSEGEKCAS